MVCCTKGECRSSSASVGVYRPLSTGAASSACASAEGVSAAVVSSVRCLLLGDVSTGACCSAACCSSRLRFLDDFLLESLDFVVLDALGVSVGAMLGSGMVQLPVKYYAIESFRPLNFRENCRRRVRRLVAKISALGPAVTVGHI